jgi:hypothetical protein
MAAVISSGITSADYPDLLFSTFTSCATHLDIIKTKLIFIGNSVCSITGDRSSLRPQKRHCWLAVLAFPLS